jgi:hypothetical protein
MSYPLNKIEEVVERIEYERVLDDLSSLEQQEGFVERRLSLTEKTKGYLEFLGGISVGISVGIFTFIFSFLLFVWLLHIEVNPQTGISGKSPKEPLATADHVLPKYNDQETSEHHDEENSKETKNVLKYASQYFEQAAKWVSQKLKAGIVNVIEGFRLIIDKLKKVIGWDTEEPGKDFKERGAILPKKGFIQGTEETPKKTGGVYQQENPSRPAYSIQVGVFKNYSNADALKTRLIKRGYNAYVNFVGSERKGNLIKLCKVWIGEFTDKEKAMKVSMEIKKAEGLEAFVTMKE